MPVKDDEKIHEFDIDMQDDWSKQIMEEIRQCKGNIKRIKVEKVDNENKEVVLFNEK